MADENVANFAVFGNTQDKTFGARRLDLDRKSVSDSYGVSLFARLEVCNLLGGKGRHGVEEISRRRRGRLFL